MDGNTGGQERTDAFKRLFKSIEEQHADDNIVPKRPDASATCHLLERLRIWLKNEANGLTRNDQSQD
jgi:hypothetical protein